MGVAQHHDAVSGTAKQYVNDDYTARVNVGLKACDSVVQEYMQTRFGIKHTDTCHSQKLVHNMNG